VPPVLPEGTEVDPSDLDEDAEHLATPSCLAIPTRIEGRGSRDWSKLPSCVTMPGRRARHAVFRIGPELATALPLIRRKCSPYVLYVQNYS
jgi:hypothetical protein